MISAAETVTCRHLSWGRALNCDADLTASGHWQATSTPSRMPPPPSFTVSLLAEIDDLSLLAILFRWRVGILFGAISFCNRERESSRMTTSFFCIACINCYRSAVMIPVLKHSSLLLFYFNYSRPTYMHELMCINFCMAMKAKYFF